MSGLPHHVLIAPDGTVARNYEVTLPQDLEEVLAERSEAGGWEVAGTSSEGKGESPCQFNGCGSPPVQILKHGSG